MATVANSITKLSKVKDKKRILKAERKKQLATYKGAPIHTISELPNKNFAGQEREGSSIETIERTVNQNYYSAKLSYRITQEIDLSKQMTLRQIITTKTDLNATGCSARQNRRMLISIAKT